MGTMPALIPRRPMIQSEPMSTSTWFVPSGTSCFAENEAHHVAHHCAKQATPRYDPGLRRCLAAPFTPEPEEDTYD
jgi:hypothetical protein